MTLKTPEQIAWSIAEPIPARMWGEEWSPDRLYVMNVLEALEEVATTCYQAGLDAGRAQQEVER